MRTAVCTGSFDPVTLGHMDVFIRSAALFDRIYIAVLTNPGKRYMFTAAERCSLIEEAARAEGLLNVFAEVYDGLAVEFARKKGAATIIRGIRNGGDMQYETAMEQANKFLQPDIETVYLAARPELSFISSSIVKEIAGYGRDIDGLVPDAIKNKIAERLMER